MNNLNVNGIPFDMHDGGDICDQCGEHYMNCEVHPEEDDHAIPTAEKALVQEIGRRRATMNTKTISVIREQEILVEVPVVLTHAESKQYALSYAKQNMNSSEWTTERLVMTIRGLVMTIRLPR